MSARDLLTDWGRKGGVQTRLLEGWIVVQSDSASRSTDARGKYEERAHEDPTLASLAEARDMLEDMRGAVTTADVQALNAIALQASALRARAEALAELQRQIRSSAR